jgi:hypothetical protein
MFRLFFFGNPGVDVMITIFGEKIGVFLKNQCYDHYFLQKIAVVWAKNAKFFAKFFGENIFKIITSVADRLDLKSLKCVMLDSWNIDYECLLWTEQGPMLWFLKIFSPKNSAKKLAFLTQNKGKLFKILIITLVFEKNANFFAKNCRKSQKIVIITSTPAHWRIFYGFISRRIMLTVLRHFVEKNTYRIPSYQTTCCRKPCYQMTIYRLFYRMAYLRMPHQ